MLYSDASSDVTVEMSDLDHNTANVGGVLYSNNNSIISIEKSFFYDNIAIIEAGVLYSNTSTITVGSCNFSNNTSPNGAVITGLNYSKIQGVNYSLFYNSSANNHGELEIDLDLLDSKLNGNISSSVIFSNNLGLLVAFYSNVTFTGGVRFVNATNEFQEKSAVTLSQKSNSTIKIVRNADTQLLSCTLLIGILFLLLL